MKRLIEFFINRSLLVNVLSVIILILGVLSALKLKRDTFPEVDFDVISIFTTYPGSTPEDVEKIITIEIERSLQGVDGIKELNSISLEGRSMIFIKVDPDYNDDKVLTDTKDAMDTISNFPTEVETPTVKKLNSAHRSIISVALLGDDEYTKRKMAKKLRDKIESIPGVARVGFSGYSKEQIVVEVFLEKLNYYQITIDEVIQAIKSRNINLSGGTIKMPENDFLIQTTGEFKNIKDIEKVVIRSNQTGSHVTVSQVGKVYRALNSNYVYQRTGKKPSILLNVRKKRTADAIKVTEKAKKVIEDFFSQRKNTEIDYVIVNEMAYYIKRRLGVLTSNGLFGMCFVLIVLMLFLNVRVSLVTSLGAPLSFLTAFFIMDCLGISFDLISMFGLILVLGMLVDDAIIVSEYFYQYIEKGMEPKKAAATAAYNTILPVTATIITTMLAFGSLFFMGGIMGKFLWPVPAVVIICLAASWLECFFILPSHLADFTKPQITHKKKLPWYTPLQKIYEKVLKLCIRRYFLTSCSFGIVLMGCLFLTTTMRFELFPGDDVREVIININGQVGDPIHKIEKAILKAEDVLYEVIRQKELRTVRGIIGVQIRQQNARSGSHYGGIIIYLTEPIERERSTDEILAEVKKELKQALTNHTFSIDKRVGGPPRGKPVDIQLKSNSMEDLEASSKKILELLTQTKGMRTPSRSYEQGKIQLTVEVDEKESKRMGLTTSQIALSLRNIYGENAITKIRQSDEDIDVIIKLDEKSRTKLHTLDDLYLLNKQKKRIKLSRVASIKQERGPFIIQRIDQKRTVSITSDINKEQTTSIQLARELKPKVEKIVAEYNDMSFEFGGENKDTNESMIRLAHAGVMALGAIFLVLVAIFASLAQPLLILSSIPLGLIGVILTFKVLGMPLGFMAIMGIIGLIGVVVNDSIVLINFINQRRESGEPLVDAITQACHSRFRPIILTTLTTVAGLLPIAHGIGGDPFLKPMAISFAWGLMFSTLVTLLFMPCSYLFYYKFKRFLVHKISKQIPQ